MFYQTTVLRVTQGGVIDVQGKELSLIGNKFVKAGDLIWTDGKIVFGHTPIRGSALLESTPSGIPVLGKNFRGYFDKRGHYKRYNIAGDEWIVNDKKIYAHDNGEENIIDAEIARDSNGKEIGVYTVEKSVKQLEEYDDDYYYYYHHYQRDSILNRERFFYSMYDFTKSEVLVDEKISFPFKIRFDDSDFAIRDEMTLKECSITLKKNGVTVETIDFTNLIELAKNEAAEYINIPIDNNVILSLWDHKTGRSKEVTETDYFKTRGLVLNFKILSNGKWSALVEIEVFAERDFTNNYYGLQAAATADMLFLYKVDSDSDEQEIARYGTFKPFVFEQWANYIEDSTYGEYLKMHNKKSTKPEFPTIRLKDDSLAPGLELIAVPLGSLSGSTPVNINVIWMVSWDSRLMPGAPDYDNELKEFEDDFDFPVQDGYQANLQNVNNQIERWKLAGVYDSGNNKIFGEILPADTNAHKWNMSLVPLKGKEFLFGVHGGKLYKVRGGTLEQVGDGLKNFRLRELKRISKAKK